MYAAMRVEASDDILLSVFAHAQLSLAERLRLGLATSKRWWRLLLSELHLSRLDAWHLRELLQRVGPSHVVRCIDVSSLQELHSDSWDAQITALFSSLRGRPGEALQELKLWSTSDFSAGTRRVHSISSEELAILNATCPNLRAGTRLAVCADSPSTAVRLLDSLPEGRHSLRLWLWDCDDPPRDDAAAVALDCAALLVLLRCPLVAALCIDYPDCNQWIGSESGEDADAALELAGRQEQAWVDDGIIAQLSAFFGSRSETPHLEHLRVSYIFEIGARKANALSSEELDIAFRQHAAAGHTAAANAAAAEAKAGATCPLQSVGLVRGLVQPLAAAVGSLKRLELGGFALCDLAPQDDGDDVPLGMVLQHVGGTLEALSLGWKDKNIRLDALLPCLGALLARPGSRLRTLELIRWEFCEAGRDDAEATAPFESFCSGIASCASLRSLELIMCAYSWALGRRLGAALAARDVGSPLGHLMLEKHCLRRARQEEDRHSLGARFALDGARGHAPVILPGARSPVYFRLTLCAHFFPQAMSHS